MQPAVNPFPAQPAPAYGRPVTPHRFLSVGGLSIELNTPQGARSEFRSGVEVAQRLPPYQRREVYRVDDFAPEVLPEWPRSENGIAEKNIASYFTSVKPGQGMWFDFNPCAQDQYHVAIVPSVQGVNSVTGKPASLDMQQYLTHCPVHHSQFGHGRHCSECGYAWPKQNYVASTGSPNGQFWLDGFRQADGKVRQWLFTDEALRGVATHVLGDKRVYMVAFAIYRSLAQKPPRPPIPRGSYYSDSSELIGSSGLESLGARTTRSLRSKSIEVGAGALINQFVHDDPRDLSFWSPVPVGIIMMSYATDEVVQQILSARRSVQNEGPLTGIPVGNA